MAMSRLLQTMEKSDSRRRRPVRRARAIRIHEPPNLPATSLVSDDLRLFALTFLGGFLFMTVYLA